jgi:hypothetical protein
LLIRRNIDDGDLCLLHAWCPVGTPIKTLVSVEGSHRWADSFETAKNELGLDFNETRSRHGWHRHVSLVMLRLRQDGGQPVPCKQADAQNQAGTFNDPLVEPGNLPRSPPPRTATHRSCLPHRMVALAARTSGRCSNIARQAEITTVMLISHAVWQQSVARLGGSFGAV